MALWITSCGMGAVSVTLARIPKALRAASRVCAAGKHSYCTSAVPQKGVRMMQKLTRRKALAVTPGLVASTVITWMIGLVLPGWLALPPFVTGPLLLLVLLFGGLEPLGVSVLRGGRAVNSDEAAAVAPAADLLQSFGALPPDYRIYVIPGSTGWDTWGSGRRSILMTEDLLWATSRGALDDRAVAAFLAHSAGRVRHGLTRNDLAIEFWSLPWTVIRGVLDTMLGNTVTVKGQWDFPVGGQ